MFGQKLIPGLLIVLAAGLAQAADFRPWTSLSPQQRAALAPLAGNWDRLLAAQQDKLLAVARGYPNLAPQQQRLLHARLRSWSQMTAEQRQIARQNYQQIQSLPKQDQSKIRQQWLETLCQEFGRPASASPPAP